MKPLPYLLFSLLLSFSARAVDYTVSSPDKQLAVTFGVKAGVPWYSIGRAGKIVLQPSVLGLLREDEDFSKGLVVVSVSGATSVTDRYELLTAKRRINTYQAVKRILHLKSAAGKPLDIIFQVANDGVAFRYYFPDRSAEIKKISKELTAFHVGTSATAWLQPMADARSGWAQANPSYEEYYQKGIAAGTPSPIKAGWVFPALFRTGENWVLLTETFPEGNYCGTRLLAESPGGIYAVGFPQSPEAFPGGALNPESTLPWYTPWRIVTVGSLKTIVESTLGTSLAQPAIKMDPAFIKPGKASWSWVLLKDDSTVYSVQKRFIDYAADMHWEYCLIDADWDRKIGYEKIKELADYAKTKQVGILLWYNSAGDWNTTPQTPRSKMLTHADRVKEFTLLRDMGVKGIKVDFFGGDGQSMLQYYRDILQDAADFKLLVNFHGSSLPRGLQRTYPNLVSMEAIKGMEFATFEQKNEDEQPAHCAMLPFTRNVFDPMDYTPMALYKIPRIQRKTTSAFELALPVLFLSGIQHLAETPEGMSHVPPYVKQFLQKLPANWDDVRFIDGFPGKLAVIARKTGKQWIVAGINGENKAKELQLDLSFLSSYKTATLITDGETPNSFTRATLTPGVKTPLQVKANGGFVLFVEQP